MWRRPEGGRGQVLHGCRKDTQEQAPRHTPCLNRPRNTEGLGCATRRARRKSVHVVADCYTAVAGWRTIIANGDCGDRGPSPATAAASLGNELQRSPEEDREESLGEVMPQGFVDGAMMMLNDSLNRKE